MAALDNLKIRFEEAKKNPAELAYPVFELVWLNFTRFAYMPEATPVLDEIYEWSMAQTQAHPEIPDLANLTHGSVAFLQDRFDYSEKLLFQARDSYNQKNDEDGVAACQLSLGFLHRSRGDLGTALKYGLNGLERLTHSGKFPMFYLIGCYWIGSIYTETGHLDDAMDIFNNGFKSDYTEGLHSIGARITSGLATVYMKQKKYDLALEHYLKALDLTDENTENTFRSRGLTDLADYYQELGDYKLAIHYNEEALKLRREMKLQNASITNYINLARIFIHTKNYERSKTILFEALRIATEINVTGKLSQIHRMLSDIYYETGQTDECLMHFKKFHEINEQLNHEDIERRVKNQIQLFQAQLLEKENVTIKAQKLEIEKEKQRSEDLLRNILPEEVAEELKSKGNADAKLFDEVTVLFTDFKDFTSISENMSPQELVEEIHNCFKAFDEIIEKYGIEKIKTIGDSYMCAAGLPVPNKTHAFDMVKAALEIRDFIETHKNEYEKLNKVPFQVRIGIHTGPVVAGIVGIRKFAYDIWGDTVNTASRMESSGEAGKVNISGSTYEQVKNQFNCVYRGKVEAKHKGAVDMYFVEGEKKQMS